MRQQEKEGERWKEVRQANLELVGAAKDRILNGVMFLTRYEREEAGCSVMGCLEYFYRFKGQIPTVSFVTKIMPDEGFLEEHYLGGVSDGFRFVFMVGKSSIFELEDPYDALRIFYDREDNFGVRREKLPERLGTYPDPGRNIFFYDLESRFFVGDSNMAVLGAGGETDYSQMAKLINRLTGILKGNRGLPYSDYSYVSFETRAEMETRISMSEVSPKG